MRTILALGAALSVAAVLTLPQQASAAGAQPGYRVGDSIEVSSARRVVRHHRVYRPYRAYRGPRYAPYYGYGPYYRPYYAPQPWPFPFLGPFWF